MTQSNPDDNYDPASQPDLPPASLGRRRFLTYMVAGPLLTVAAPMLTDSLAPATASAAVPSLPSVEEHFDIAQAIITAASPTMGLVQLEVSDDGKARLDLPRAELGQGLTTSLAMVVAEELDLPLERVDVTLADARQELLFNQMTAGSCAIRAFYDPLRHMAAAARGRLLGAAAKRWEKPKRDLFTRDGMVVAPDGRQEPFGALSALAADPSLPNAGASPKPESEHKLVGRPTRRKDARAIVTGQVKYAMDIDVPGAKPVMLRRPPTIQGTVKSVHNADDVRRMSGVIGLATIPTGVAVMAETFEEARRAVNALDVSFGPGNVDNESNESIQDKLRDSLPPLAVPRLGASTVDAEFEWAPAYHASLEPETAIADVREDRAEIWSGLQAPILVKQDIAKELGLPPEAVTVHVVQAGGGFGRRVFPDGAMEAMRVSKALKRPAKVMWHRTDDARHGRVRPPNYHKIRATVLGGQVISYEQRVAGVSTDYRHGLGEILTATATEFPEGAKQAIANDAFGQAVFLTMVSSPYNFGVYDKTLTELPLGMNTASYRSVPCQTARGCEEIVVDEIAAKLREDPVALRRDCLKNDRARAVLDKAAEAGEWGKRMPAGFAQGVGYHEESRAKTASVIELDGRDPKKPKVTKATIVIDVGKVINPLGLEAQMLGCLAEAISLTLKAGLHIKNGLPLEGSYHEYHFARQKDYPADVNVVIMPPNGGELGGAGEVGMAAPTGAIANAYARATGIKPRRFPINHPVDFEPVPPGHLPAPPIS